MIKLKNVEGQIELDLSIVGYKYPDQRDDDWCLVKVVVNQNGRVFEAVDSSLEAAELPRLLDWFRALSQFRLPRFATQSFTEPCLEFKFLACHEGKVLIGILLSDELKPTFRIKQFHRIITDWTIVCELSTSHFADIIHGIEEAIKAYPRRTTSFQIMGGD